MLPDITPQEVAAYAPNAPPVTALQIEEAGDWLDARLTRAALTLTPNTAAWRAARRALMAYALHLATEERGAGAGATATSGAVVSERKKVGDLEVERKYASGDQLASGAASSASQYLSDALRHLRAAGVTPGPRVVGVSR